VEVPVPGRPRRPGAPAPDPDVDARIQLLHAEGASLHTIAAALNQAGAPNPAGVRWHAHAVARHVAAAG
jgi:hypothetical protein